MVHFQALLFVVDWFKTASMDGKIDLQEGAKLIIGICKIYGFHDEIVLFEEMANVDN